MTDKFSEFIDKKFVNWQAQQGKRKTLDEFAAFIGVSRPLLSMWNNGVHRPGKENIKLLVEIFGPEVYDALDIPRPDPDLDYISEHFRLLKEEERHALRSQVEMWVEENERRMAEQRRPESNT